MKYKHIDAMLHNFGHSFVSLMNYDDDEYIIDILGAFALEAPGWELDIDFGTGEIAPPAKYPAKLHKSVAHWREWLPKHMENHQVDPSCLTEVHLRYRLVRTDYRLSGREVIVSARDDRGKDHKVFVHG